VRKLKRIGLFFALCVLCYACQEQVSLNHSPTWSADIAPIIFQNCTPCHRPGEAGAFNLLSYDDAAKRGRLIRFVTHTRYMPPWPADASYSHFIGERVLNEEQIKLISDWVEKDCPRGDSAIEPAAPTFYKGSFFGKPDLVVRAVEPIAIKGNGEDVFLIQKFPFEMPHDTLVQMIEFVPHQRKLVHHVNGHLLAYDEGRNVNYFSGENQHADTRAQLMEVYKNMHIPYADQAQPQFPAMTPNAVYYLPGFLPPSYPKEIGGYRLKRKGVFLLNNIHYGPSNKDLIDSSHINVFFRKDPVQRPIAETQLGTFGVSDIEPEFIIPPNEIKTFHTQTTLRSDISLLSVNPHMHLVGKTFWAFALDPKGDTIPLIKINKWDFRWQYYYTYEHPVHLPAGSTIHVYGTFDNTNKNPNNPYHPPQTITQGNGIESMKTTEEMFQFIFTYVPYKSGDEKIDLTPKK
jgi:mono/diheme cytochrome c family protein